MRVLLATGSPDLGHALSLFLSERPIHVVDVVDDSGTLLSQTADARPDVVVVDWRLGASESKEMVALLMTADHPTPVIILSTPQQRPKARACGAAACATLGDPPDTLVAAIHEVCSRAVDDTTGPTA